jgi:hypothetical protein
MDVEHSDMETTWKLIDALKQNIKAFNGDVYGNILTLDQRDLMNSSQTLVIHCRVDIYLFGVFIQVLNLHFDVESFPMVFNEFMGINKQYIITPKGKPDKKIMLDVCFQAAIEWSKIPCDLDVHLLAENASSVFLRSNYICLDKFVDKIGFVKKRIEQKKFTLLDASLCRTTEKLRLLVDRSESMIQRGWVMDDILYGEAIWNINMWLTYKIRPHACRVFHNKKKLEMLTSLNECPLCNEEFTTCDIVINTKCNHNFHWCNNRCKGLSEWLKRGNISCPVCRKNAL